MLQPSQYYHIYNHANGRENLFVEQENYRYFLQQYQKYISPVADTLAYCLMPNHLHLVVRIKEIPDLPGFENLEGLTTAISKQFSNLFNSYTKAFNKKYNRSGSLLQKNFRRKLIDNDDYLRTVITYVHINTVPHGFTDQLTDWEHSSYHHLINTDDSWLASAYIPALYGNSTDLSTSICLQKKKN